MVEPFSKTFHVFIENERFLMKTYLSLLEFKLLLVNTFKW